MLRSIFGGSKARKVSFVAGLVVAAVSLFGLATLAPTPALAATCSGDGNDVYYKGFSGGASDFINKIQGTDGLGHHDFATIYSAFGLSPSNYTDFAKTAVQGVANRNGNVYIGSDVVGINGQSFGRTQGCHGTGEFSFAGLWGNTFSKTFASGTQTIGSLIYFNDDGVPIFGVMNVCGNPIRFTPVTPSFSCKALNVTPDNNKVNTYNFTTNAPVSGYGVSVAKVVYDFGDGKTAESTNPSANVSHTYDKPGKYTAKVTVYVNLPGGKSKTIVAAGDCVHVVEVPSFECTVLNSAILSQDDKTKLVVRFVAQATVSGGAKLTSGDFSFGDGTPDKTGVNPDAGGLTVTWTHTYTNITGDKDFSADAAAVLHFMLDGGGTATADTCKAQVTATKTTPECKPGIPVGDVRCNPCPSDSSLPADSDKCVPPHLPNTGAGNTIAIFAAVLIGGFLVYRQLLFRKHRAAFVAADEGTSPLPLGDPLNGNPLAGTPYDTGHQSRNFRRKRLF